MALAGFEPARCPTVSGPLCPLSYSAIYRLFTGISRFSQAVRGPGEHYPLRLSHPKILLGKVSQNQLTGNPQDTDKSALSSFQRGNTVSCRMRGATSRPGFVGWLCRAAYNCPRYYGRHGSQGGRRKGGESYGSAEDVRPHAPIIRDVFGFFGSTFIHQPVVFRYKLNKSLYPPFRRCV